MAPCRTSSRLLALDAASALDAFPRLADRFRPSVLDVLKVAHDLTHGTLAPGSPGSARIPLPADVALLILRRAEYFHSRHAERLDNTMVSKARCGVVVEGGTRSSSPIRGHYETPPAEGDVGHAGLQYVACDSAPALPPLSVSADADSQDAACVVPHPQLERVDVAVVSHDQGWASSAGSWTWGTLAVLPQPLDGSDAARQGAFAPLSAGGVWQEEVYRNARAEARWQLHEASWGPRSALVALLRRDGGCVALQQRAQFPGWVNHVLCASITLTFS